MDEFAGLSFEEKLAYLDLQLTNLYGEAWRERADAVKFPSPQHPAPSEARVR